MTAPDLDILLVQLQDGRSAVRVRAARDLARNPDKFAKKSLLKSLKDSSPEVRYWSVVALQTMMDVQILQEFLTLLIDSSRLVRLEVVRAVGRTQATAAFEPLLEMLGDPDADVRSLASLMLSKFKDQLLVKVLDELSSSNWNKKHHAFQTMILAGSRAHPMVAAALRKKGLHKEVVYWLLKLCGELRLRSEFETIVRHMREAQDEDVLICGLETLGKLGNAESVPVLLEWLNHPSERIREGCVQALTDLGEHALSQLLLRLEDESRLIRFTSSKALSRIGELSIGPLLEKFHARDSEGRYWILDALRRMKVPIARSIFLTLSREEEGDIQNLAIQALGEYPDDKEVQQCLLELLEHEQWKIRNEAARSLSRIKPDAELLLERLQDGSSNCRYWMIQIMQTMKDPRFYEALVRVFDDSDWVLRTAASDAIRQMGWHHRDLVNQILLSGDENRIFWMTRSLYGERDRHYVDSLVRCLACRQAGIVENVSHILRAMGTLAQGRLVQVFRERWPRHVYSTTVSILSSDPDLAREAVLELFRGESREEHYWATQIAQRVGNELCDTFLPLLEASDWKLRSNAVLALGAIRSPKAVTALAEVLQDEYTLIRRQAVAALGQIGDTRAMAWIKPLLDAEDLELRLLVIHTIGQLGGSEAVEPIRQALSEDNWLIQRQGLRAAASSPDPELVPDLLRFCERGQEELLEDLIKACAAFSDKRFAPFLRSLLLEAKDSNQTEQIVLALGQCGDAEDLQLLVEQLKGSVWIVRKAAADALGSLRLQESIPALKEALGSSDPVLRMHLRDAMKKILGPGTWQKLLTDHLEASRSEQAENFFKSATESLSRKEFRPALRNINQALALHQKLKYLTLKARLHAELKEFHRAEKVFLEILKSRPDDLKTQCNLALLYFVQGNYAATEDVFAGMDKRSDLPEEVLAVMIRTRQKMKAS